MERNADKTSSATEKYVLVFFLVFSLKKTHKNLLPALYTVPTKLSLRSKFYSKALLEFSTPCLLNGVHVLVCYPRVSLVELQINPGVNIKIIATTTYCTYIGTTSMSVCSILEYYNTCTQSTLFCSSYYVARAA